MDAPFYFQCKSVSAIRLPETLLNALKSYTWVQLNSQMLNMVGVRRYRTKNFNACTWWREMRQYVRQMTGIFFRGYSLRRMQKFLSLLNHDSTRTEIPTSCVLYMISTADHVSILLVLSLLVLFLIVTTDYFAFRHDKCYICVLC